MLELLSYVVFRTECYSMLFQYSRQWRIHHAAGCSREYLAHRIMLIPQVMEQWIPKILAQSRIRWKMRIPIAYRWISISKGSMYDFRWACKKPSQWRWRRSTIRHIALPRKLETPEMHQYWWFWVFEKSLQLLSRWQRQSARIGVSSKILSDSHS